MKIIEKYLSFIVLAVAFTILLITLSPYFQENKLISFRDRLPLLSPPPISPIPTEIKNNFCGGIAGKKCPSGSSCILDNNHPDAGRHCTGSGYSCPKNDWIDCMPGPGPVKSQCSRDFIDWATVNCPNFKGIAL